MNKPRVSIIAAIDEKRGLGKNNDLLFKISEDFKRMRSLTTGHPIIMGRKTFESIGRVLPNRMNIIITRDPSYKVEGAIVVGSLEEGITIAKKVEREKMSSPTRSGIQTRDSRTQPGIYDLRGNDSEGEIFIFGGGQIFKEALEKNLVDRLYLTIVKGDYGADIFFPDYSNFKTIISKEDHQSGGYSYTFLDVEK